jgi:uncharacterized protein (DUF1778 family)
MMHRMATKNPRITITLTPSTHSILQELSRLTGESMSAIVADLLSSNEHVFQRMVAVLQAAKQVKDQGRTEMLSALEKAQGKIEQQLGLALDSLDEGTRPILQHAEKVTRRAAKAAKGTEGAPLRGGGSGTRSGVGSGARPPLLTGGSGLEKPVQKPSRENDKKQRGASK